LFLPRLLRVVQQPKSKGEERKSRDNTQGNPDTQKREHPDVVVEPYEDTSNNAAPNTFVKELTLFVIAMAQ
jgi:hypothetical protein